MKTLRKHRTIVLILMLPVILLLNAVAFTVIMELIRDTSDMSVVLGVLLISAMFAADYLVIKFIYSLFKTKTKKQKHKNHENN